MAPHPITEIVDGISRHPPAYDAARPTISAGDRDGAGSRASRSLARFGRCGLRLRSPPYFRHKQHIASATTRATASLLLCRLVGTGWDPSAASAQQRRPQRRDRREGRQSLRRTPAGAPVPQPDQVQSERIRCEVLGRDRTRRLCQANCGRRHIESAHRPRSERTLPRRRCTSAAANLLNDPACQLPGVSALPDAL
jgi:hypothetical protein